MMIRHILLVCSVVLLLAGAVQAQSASDSKGEVFFGYALNRTNQEGALQDAGVPNDIGSLNLNGFNFQLGLDVGHTNTTNFIGIVGDIGGYFGTHRKLTPDDPQDLKMYTLTMGPQFTNRSHGILQPFVRALAGVSYIDGNYGGGISDDTGFALILGGGLDIKVHPSVAIRMPQLDYIGMRHNSVTIHNFRFATGLTVLF
jgi:hypothetical protein